MTTDPTSPLSTTPNTDHTLMQAIVTYELNQKAHELQQQGLLNDLAHPDDAFAHFFVILEHCYNNLDPSNDWDLDIG
jgi:hypothetical protein